MLPRCGGGLGVGLTGADLGEVRAEQMRRHPGAGVQVERELTAERLARGSRNEVVVGERGDGGVRLQEAERADGQRRVGEREVQGGVAAEDDRGLAAEVVAGARLDRPGEAGGSAQALGQLAGGAAVGAGGDEREQQGAAVGLEPVPWDGETMGEIMFRGNLVMKGYLKNPKATEESFAGGWFHTGDLAVVHSDGYVKIKDRSKDVIISGGENISSLEVEDVLYRHPAIKRAAVRARRVFAAKPMSNLPLSLVEYTQAATKYLAMNS